MASSWRIRIVTVWLVYWYSVSAASAASALFPARSARQLSAAYHLILVVPTVTRPGWHFLPDLSHQAGGAFPRPYRPAALASRRSLFRLVQKSCADVPGCQAQGRIEEAGTH